MSLLITRPYYDKVTHYFFHWSQKLIVEAQNHHIKVFDLAKKKATRKIVESYLRKQVPSLVIFNGHGNSFCINGQDNEMLITTRYNEHFLVRKKVYIRACNAGETLGMRAMASGAIGFIGYKRPFIFWYNPEMLHRPLEDEFAKPFLECSNQVGISLIKGKSIKESHERSIKLYRKKIVEMLTSEAQNSFILPELLANMNNQVCYDSSLE